jgi:hypothetical protein
MDQSGTVGLEIRLVTRPGAAKPRMTMLRLINLINDLSLRSWPDGSKLRWVRAKFLRFGYRVIAGAFAGLVVGSLIPIIGLGLSGVDVRDAATLDQMVKLVILSAGVWAVIVACIVDFAYLYLRFLESQHSRWARKTFVKDRKMWEGEIDSLLLASSSPKKPRNLDCSDTAVP